MEADRPLRTNGEILQSERREMMVRPAGLEPATYRVEIGNSNPVELRALCR